MKNKKSEIPEVQEAMKHVYHETKKDKLKSGVRIALISIVVTVVFLLAAQAVGIVANSDTFVGRLVALMLDYLPFTILIIGTIVIFINGLRKKR